MAAASDLDERGVLRTESGHEIPQLTLTGAMLMNRTVALYGASNSGKTIFTKHIMKLLNGPVEQVLLVSPTEPSNRSYEGYVAPPFIHSRLYLPDPANPKKDDGPKGALRFLNAVWQRQEMMAAIYTRVNDADVLGSLYRRLPRGPRAEGLRYITAMNERRVRLLAQLQQRHGGDAGRCAEQVKGVNAKFEQMLVLLYKKYIAPAHASLWARPDLTEDEAYALTYLNFNPRLLLVFDDCAAELKSLFSKEIFRKLFYQNRHSMVTLVMCCQDDTDLPANLRKNVFVSIFMSEVVCQSNFERGANQFGKAMRAVVAAVAPEVFRGTRKLAYIRDDPRGQHLYHVSVPSPTPAIFGSDALQELCAAVQSDSVSMDTDNPFYSHFRL